MLLLFLLLALSSLGVIFNMRKLGLVGLSLSLALLLGVGQGWIPALVLSNLQSSPPLATPSWKSKNVIVLLGIGTVKWPGTDVLRTHSLGFSRVFEAARLWQDCKKLKGECFILSTGGDPRKYGTSEAEVLKLELTQLGVSAESILVESKSNNTFQNAQFSSEIIQNEKFDQIILVTSGTHLRRGLLYFSHFGVIAVGAPSDYLSAISAVLPLAHNFAMLDIAIHEYIGLIRYPIYNLLGLQSGGAKPGSS
ncbi:MAG: YdcF family protein [Bdellovibrionales bacterium]